MYFYFTCKILVFPVAEAPRMATLRTFKGQPCSHSSDSSRVKRYVEIHLFCTRISISKEIFLAVVASLQLLLLFVWILMLLPLQLLNLLALFDSNWNFLLLTGDGELLILLLLPFHIFLMKLMKRETRRQMLENVATFELLRLHFSSNFLVINLLFIMLVLLIIYSSVLVTTLLLYLCIYIESY